MLVAAGVRLQWRIRAARPDALVVELKDDFRTPNQAEFVPGGPLDRGRIVLDSSDFSAKLPNLLGQARYLVIGADLLLAQALQPGQASR